MGLPSTSGSASSLQSQAGHVRSYLLCAPAFTAQAPVCSGPLEASYTAPSDHRTGAAPTTQCARSDGTGSNKHSQDQGQLCDSTGLGLPGPAADLPAWLTPCLHRALEQQAGPAWDPGLHPSLLQQQEPALGRESAASSAGDAQPQLALAVVCLCLVNRRFNTEQRCQRGTSNA